jgi:shikimate dehydrogenase
MKKACVIGYPISHSLSPVIHNYWLRKYGIEGEYSAIEVAPKDLETFISSLVSSGFRGCNITIPHKEKAWEIFSKINHSAKNTIPEQIADFMQAINTLVVDENNKLVATNTDFIGFARNLLSAQPDYDYKNAIAYIIGSGGAAKAVAFAFASMGVSQIVITNRTISKAFDVKEMMVNKFGWQANKFDVIEWEKRNEVIKHSSIIVNATSLGMKGQPELDIDLSGLRENTLVTDIVYNPLETTFLKRAKEKGAIVVDGLGMLLHQAAPGFEAWFGKKPEVDSELRQAVLKHLNSRN